MWSYKNDTFCLTLLNTSLWTDSKNSTGIGINPSLESYECLIIFIGLGIFAAVLARSFNRIRKRIYHDKDNLDTDFDAGGKVSVGLTAATIVSQWTWAATLLQSSTVTSKYGISGTFWYSAGASVQIVLFSMLSVQLKIRAPGAKTFLQVIRARFGSKTHITYVIFALLTNLIVTAMLMLGGAAVMTNLVKNLSVVYATGLVAAVIGTYTFIGGLGATFYVSYFNTAVIFITMLILMFKVFYDPGNNDNPVGTIDEVFTYVNCSKNLLGNFQHSYATILSGPSVMFGVVNLIGNFGTVFVDQSYWQSSVAAKPKQGVWGFLSGGLTWFAVPFSFATTVGLAYIALSAYEGNSLLTAKQVESGLVPAVVAQKLMGRSGELLIVILLIMAVTSTGSAEVMAVTSIMVYDIYQLYLKPYRLVLDANSCILCGKARGRNANPRDKCKCISMTFCADCVKDDEARKEWKRAIKPAYKCRIHGSYREYNDYLIRLKNWCILWSTIAIVPLTMTLDMMKVNLNWLYMFMGILIGSSVVPIALSMCWSRLTGIAMMLGAICGAILGLTSWLVTASTYEGGLGNFFKNTGQNLSMLIGNVTAISCGAIFTVIISFATNRNYGPHMEYEVWENTRDIDNPLSPWTELYARELNISSAHELDNRPTLQDVSKTFRSAKLFAYIGASVFTLIILVLWPVGMIAVNVMDITSFSNWVKTANTWAFLGAIFIIIMPLVNEAIEIYHVTKEKRVIQHMSPSTEGSGYINHTHSCGSKDILNSFVVSKDTSAKSDTHHKSQARTDAQLPLAEPIQSLPIGSKSGVHNKSFTDEDLDDHGSNPREPVF